MKHTTTLLAAAMALGLAACNNQDPANDTTGVSVDSTAVAHGTGADRDRGDMIGGTDGTTAARANPLADNDRKALMAVEEVDRHEVAAAEDALAKNVEGEVRDYARTLRDDHTRNLEATRRLMGSGVTGRYAATAGRTPAVTGETTSDPAGAGEADTGGIAAGAPADAGMHADAGLTAMRDRHEAERARLAALDGEAFATAWVDAMAKGHEEALAKLDEELIPGAADDDVARHLRDTRSAIAEHLDTARALQADR